MIKPITKPIILKYEDRMIKMPPEIEDNIKKFWSEAKEENPNLFNGENHSVESVVEKEDCIEMKVAKTNYATYLYNERIGIPDKNFRIIHIWSGILLETKDDYFVIGEMCDTTSIPKCLQIPGGGISDEDISDGELDINFNLKRELEEELYLNLDNIQYEMKYLECPTEKRSVYGFIAIGKLDMTKEELNTHFENYKNYLKENDLELEFSRLIFLNKSTAAQELDKLDNPKREYLRDLIEICLESN